MPDPCRNGCTAVQGSTLETADRTLRWSQGGAYLTLLNTIANMGVTLPKLAIFAVMDLLSTRSCIGALDKVLFPGSLTWQASQCRCIVDRSIADAAMPYTSSRHVRDCCKSAFVLNDYPAPRILLTLARHRPAGARLGMPRKPCRGDVAREHLRRRGRHLQAHDRRLLRPELRVHRAGCRPGALVHAPAAAAAGAAGQRMAGQGVGAQDQLTTGACRWGPLRRCIGLRRWPAALEAGPH